MIPVTRSFRVRPRQAGGAENHFQGYAGWVPGVPHLAKRPLASRQRPAILPDELFEVFLVVVALLAVAGLVVVFALVVVIVLAGLAEAVAVGGHLVNLPLASLHWVAAEAAAGRAMTAKAAMK